MVPAALAHRAVLPDPQDPGLQAGGQRRQRRATHQAGPDRRQGSGRHHPARPGPRWPAILNPLALPSIPPKSNPLCSRPKSRSQKQTAPENPHPPERLAWAGWIIARLGGWDGYPKSKPPGPITSETASNTSTPSPKDGASEMCACPSAKAGDPVRRGLSALSPASLEYWVARSAPGDDSGVCFTGRLIHTWKFVLAARCARGFPENSRALKTRGRGNAGCALHPRSHVQGVERKRT